MDALGTFIGLESMRLVDLGWSVNIHLQFFGQKQNIGDIG